MRGWCLSDPIGRRCRGRRPLATGGRAGFEEVSLVCSLELVTTTNVWVFTAGFVAPFGPLGHRSPTKFPSSACPKTEEEEAPLSLQEAPSADCTLVRPFTQLDEQL